jgi:serine/threonine-protein kinase
VTLERHITIATVAFANGFIDSTNFVDVMSALRGAAGPLTVDEVWLESGRLTQPQLGELIAAIDGTGPGTAARMVAATGDTLPFTAFAQGTRPLDVAALMTARTERGLGGARAVRTDEIAAVPAPDSQISDGQTTIRGLGDDIAVEETRLERKSSERAAVANTGLLTVAESVRAARRAAELVGDDAPRALSRYERRATLGAGGLGEVAACHDSLLGRMVAVKAARDENDVEAQSILEREARIIAGLEHPNIIPVYDAGANIGGGLGGGAGAGPYYVMRVVHQPSLDEVLERLRKGDVEARKEYNLKRLLRYFVQICHAVDFAHSRGVIHCDLKPANVLLGAFGEVLVVDWGLAWSAEHPEGPRGGTPGFMAPEQFDTETKGFDARTDVFALGAVLYQCLALRPAFPIWISQEAGTTTGSAPVQRYPAPVPPSEHPTEWKVPAEVEEVCLRALSLDPAARFDSARELASAIDDHLEGTKELERKLAEADRCTETGDELAERYHEFVESRPDDLTQVAAVRAATPPWASIEDKQELWNAEDMLEVTDALRVRTLQAAQSAYEQAIEALPDHAGARRGLARLFWVELQRARQARDALDQIYFEGLVRQYDDGSFLKNEHNEGQLVIERVSSDAELTLCALIEEDRRLVVASERPFTPNVLTLHRGGTTTPLSMPERLEAGSYILRAARPGARPVRYPFLIQPGGQVTLRIDVSPADRSDDDEVFVPGGTALLDESADSREVDVPAFFLARYPVTFAAYLEFVEATRQVDEAAVEALLPASALGMPYVRRESGLWTAAGLTTELLMTVPVFGVTARAAAAYAAWISERSGRAARLPREREWEKAARGADGRPYPWGDHFDATFCKMRQSRKGESTPEPSGAFPVDESPYGVRDLAGGVADWTWADTDEERRVGDYAVAYSRGGAWCDWSDDCRSSARRMYLATERAQRVGFRLARDA